jgi:hypothetical protein
VIKIEANYVHIEIVLFYGIKGINQIEKQVLMPIIQFLKKEKEKGKES